MEDAVAVRREPVSIVVQRRELVSVRNRAMVDGEFLK